MSTSIKKVAPKKRGRPATGKDPLVGVRLPQEMINSIEAMADEGNIPRSEAIRRLIQAGLRSEVALELDKDAARKGGDTD